MVIENCVVNSSAPSAPNPQNYTGRDRGGEWIDHCDRRQQHGAGRYASGIPRLVCVNVGRG